MKKTILKKVLNSGFAERTKNTSIRLIHKDGRFNVRKKGLSFFVRFSLYHWLIKMKWTGFFLFMFIMYLVVNLIFASAYYSLGINSINGADTSTNFDYFFKCFYFSAQTLTTVGYGIMNPNGIMPNILSIIESFVGLLSFAFATGLLYGRFSRPISKLIFSQNALIAPYKKESKGLMIRLANSTNSQVINLSAKLLLSWKDDDRRRFYNLDLEIDSISMLATSWTIVHPITEQSPLLKFNQNDFKDKDLELILQLNGFDESFAQDINVQTSYKYDEVKWNAKFESILGQDGRGNSFISLDKLSDYTQIEN